MPRPHLQLIWQNLQSSLTLCFSAARSLKHQLFILEVPLPWVGPSCSCRKGGVVDK